MLIKSNLRRIPVGLALTGLLLSTAAHPSAEAFPVRVTVRLSADAPKGPTQVLLERDRGRVWQQYLDAKSPAPDGTVTFSIQEPGTYWLLATSEGLNEVRRGACLLHVGRSGNFELRRLPRTREGKKWGGANSATCQTGTIPLRSGKRPPPRKTTVALDR
jgi:hypothetical protein